MLDLLQKIETELMDAIEREHCRTSCFNVLEWVRATLESVPENHVIAPHFRGYALLGIGAYLINHTAAHEPAELCVSIATEEEKAGRVVGDLRDNVPGALIQPEVIAVRIGFDNVAGLDALEQQLRLLREEHFSGK